MQLVGRYHQATCGNFLPDKLGIYIFGPGDKFDLVGNFVGLCNLQLRCHRFFLFISRKNKKTLRQSAGRLAAEAIYYPAVQFL